MSSQALIDTMAYLREPYLVENPPWFTLNRMGAVVDHVRSLHDGRRTGTLTAAELYIELAEHLESDVPNAVEHLLVNAVVEMNVPDILMPNGIAFPDIPLIPIELVKTVAVLCSYTIWMVSRETLRLAMTDRNGELVSDAIFAYSSSVDLLATWDPFISGSKGYPEWAVANKAQIEENIRPRIMDSILRRRLFVDN